VAAGLNSGARVAPSGRPFYALSRNCQCPPAAKEFELNFAADHRLPYELKTTSSAVNFGSFPLNRTKFLPNFVLEKEHTTGSMQSNFVDTHNSVTATPNQL